MATQGVEPDQRISEARGRKRSVLFEILETLVPTVVTFVGIQTFIAQPYKVEHLSMENIVGRAW